MSINEDLIQASTNSFWEIDQYKRTVKRHEHGSKLCDDICQMIQERADLEKRYAKDLKTWSKSWGDKVEKGPEYGTAEAAWRGMLHEADSMADIHLRVREQLLADVQQSIKLWQKDQYTKGVMGPSKQTKELEDGFKKAQKPWAKLYSKVQKAKKDYFTACKTERSAVQSEANSRKDTGVSADAVKLKKLQERVTKCQREVETSRQRYEESLNEINGYNGKYMEEMTEMFRKTQELEKQRLQFFKEMMLGFQKCLNITQTNEMHQIYDNMESTISLADDSKDLRWWSQHHGIDMAMNWPQFEDYSPEMHNIHRASKKQHVSGSEGITLTAISSKNETVSHAPSHQQYDNFAATSNQNQTRNGGWEGDQNPFGDVGDNDEFESYDSQNIDDSKGVPVRALYDYEGQEDDELSFKQGDVFVKLLDADEQGWCTGKMNGRKGLYPNNYAEPV